MKKTVALLLSCVLLVSLFGCGQTKLPEESATETTADPRQEYEAFLQALSLEPVRAVYPRLTVRQDGSAFLLTDVENSSETILMGADVMFAAFDKEGQPVKLVNDASAEYVKAAKLPDMFLDAGHTWRATMGLRLTEGYENIAYVTAMVQSYTDLEKNTIESPMCDDWLAVYREKPLESYVLEKLEKEDPARIYEEFAADVDRQKALAVNPRVIQEETATMLLADVENKGEECLTQVNLLFAAFDKEGQPVKLKTSTTEDAYVKRLELKELSVAPGEVWEADLGLRLSAVTDEIAYVYVIAEEWTAGDAAEKSDLASRWLEYFQGATLATYMMEK